jgi:hypothetical protein
LPFNDLLIHTLEVYRRVIDADGAQVTDRFGQPKSVNPRQHQVGGETLVHTYKCRAFMSAGGLKFAERMIDTFERQFTVYTDLGVDINEDDALRCVGVDGHIIFGLAKIKDSETKYDANGPHHAEYTVWEQSGPGKAVG